MACPQANWAGYDLTTLAQPIDQLAAAALDLLLAETTPNSEQDLVIEGHLRVGRTTKTDEQ